MELLTLRIENLRVFAQEAVAFAPRWNLLEGGNGSGKTSVLEAAFLLSHGRSFRTSAREALVRHGESGYSVFGEIADRAGVRRVGIARSARRLEARLDGEGVAIGELMRHAAVLCFEPGSHALVAGPSDERRRFLDWGVFHVEHAFLATWRRYQRALKQRNALLRSDASPAEFAGWDIELAAAAEPLARMRQGYFEALSPWLHALLRELLPELGDAALAFDPGFPAGHSLLETLTIRRERDLARGHTGAGPHRADFSLAFPSAPRREHLSRGQEKLCAFALVMAQARLFAATRGEWPVLGLDDLASEVDAAHQARIIAAVDASGAQVIATGTTAPAGLSDVATQVARFHVEQGQVARLV
ncbi:MAG: DNA replication/repair protein RecF [Lysobacteraceae bacterium]|nr:MAG: DNA replication/repair protein RecF [Xanthomonadaceae bacterium]